MVVTRVVVVVGDDEEVGDGAIIMVGEGLDTVGRGEAAIDGVL